MAFLSAVTWLVSGVGGAPPGRAPRTGPGRRRKCRKPAASARPPTAKIPVAAIPRLLQNISQGTYDLHSTLPHLQFWERTGSEASRSRLRNGIAQARRRSSGLAQFRQNDVLDRVRDHGWWSRRSPAGTASSDPAQGRPDAALVFAHGLRIRPARGFLVVLRSPKQCAVCGRTTCTCQRLLAMGAQMYRSGSLRAIERRLELLAAPIEPLLRRQRYGCRPRKHCTGSSGRSPRTPSSSNRPWRGRPCGSRGKPENVLRCCRS